MAEQKTRPGPNGGTLFSGGNWGNRFKAGPKPNMIRAIARSGVDDATQQAVRVVKGFRCMPVIDKNTGDVKGYRFPTQKEWEWAAEYCKGLGIPIRSEIALERPEILREMIDAMRAENVSKETIAAVVKRLGEALKDDVG